jgi:hypothetical protein
LEETSHENKQDSGSGAPPRKRDHMLTR